ncbi:hypothetical protein [Nocardia sp. NPDC057668]|uniref:hypothetical protein n=1 Tax=Nocardia sp. NPDC057668 TaxID=3346202 RepID=UPI00366CFAAA
MDSVAEAVIAWEALVLEIQAVLPRIGMGNLVVAESDPGFVGNEDRAGLDSTGLLKLFDRSLLAADNMVAGRVGRLRERHPNATNAQLIKKLETTYVSSVVASGAATGGAAAVPGAGTVAAIATVGADTSWFLTASIAHVLSVVRVHGIHLTDLEHQKAVVLMVLAGGGGARFVGKTAGRAGPHLGKLLANAVPAETIKTINKVLGRHFVTRMGTRSGVLVIGKAAPFGIGVAIGAGGNMVMAKGIVKATRIAVDTAITDLDSDGPYIHVVPD